MSSLSQALRLGDLPPPHRTFQGHATHIIEWSMMLRPNDSWSTCILQGIATFLHYASRRSAGYRYTTSASWCDGLPPVAQGADDSDEVFFCRPKSSMTRSTLRVLIFKPVCLIFCALTSAVASGSRTRCRIT